MIKDYLDNKSNNLISYFYKNKLERKDYIDFLKSLVLLVKA
jgi:hypothetical protein